MFGGKRKAVANKARRDVPQWKLDLLADADGEAASSGTTPSNVVPAKRGRDEDAVEEDGHDEAKQKGSAGESESDNGRGEASGVRVVGDLPADDDDDDDVDLSNYQLGEDSDSERQAEAERLAEAAFNASHHVCNQGHEPRTRSRLIPQIFSYTRHFHNGRYRQQRNSSSHAS